jgi:MFS family permease
MPDRGARVKSARVACHRCSLRAVEAALTPDPRRWRALALVCVAFFMVVLDVSIVNVALPSVAQDLALSQSTLQWIITAYSLAFGGFLLLGGRAADVLGRRRVFIAGMALFTFGSLMCGFAQSGAWLIAFRALQGLGGAIVTAAPNGTRPSASGEPSREAARRSECCSAAC